MKLLSLAILLSYCVASNGAPSINPEGCNQDAKILNGMVIYGVMQHRNYCPGGPNPNSVAQEPSPGVIFVVLGACAFGYIPPKRSETVIKGKGFALRNYDFPYPFYNISKYIVTTILVENDKSPTAFISMPGQIYCQNCINSHEIFMELNNGGPSGGFCINPYRRGLLIDMLMYMQNSDTFWELDFQLRTTNADVALIIGMATAAEAKLYETTAYIGSKTVAAPIGEPLISTNFFQNNTWMETLPVSDATTWHGITRWDNLQRLIHSRTQHNLQSLQTLWITPLSAGGAQWNDTIYQLLYDFSTGDLHVNNVKHGAGWTNIPLRSIFATVPKSISEPRDPSWNL